MDLELGEKVALITGGSDGLGLAVASTLGAAGARVAIVARGAERLEAARLAIAERGIEVLAVRADVSRADDCARVVAEVTARFGRLDVLVNNAGTSMARRLLDVDDAAWQADLDLKLFAAVRLARLAVPEMRKVGGGRIVNVLAISAKQPAAASVPTSVSRAAGMALTKALSKELAPENILVNAVLIGIVKSAQWRTRWEAAGKPGTLDDFYARVAKEQGVPVGRVGEASELADHVAFLVSARAAFITGVAVNFDGGASGAV